MKRIMFLVSLLIMVIGLMAQTAMMPAGNGTEENPYQITTWQNLYWITAPGSVNGLSRADRWSKHYIQTADITFPTEINTWNNGTGWSPIGFFDNISDSLSFTGTYDGDNKTITGFFIYFPSSSYQGLFGYTKDCEIKNIHLIDISVTGNEFIGGLVGYNCGTITNCYSTGTVTGTGNYSYTGGIVGFNYGIITNCYITGNVTGNNYTGGLVGSNGGGTIANSYSTGNVTGNNHTGGLVGNNGIGSDYSGTIANSYSTGDVTGNNYVGGLVGDGINGSIINSYSAGHVTGISYNGGLVGYYIGTITNCFWDTETSGQGTSSGGTGKTTAEMKSQSTYSNAGWNFYFPWKMVINSYPVLKTFEEINIIGFGSELAPYEIDNYTQLVWLSGEPSVWDKQFKQTANIVLPIEITQWNNGTGWSPIGRDDNLSFKGTYDGNNKTITGLFINRPLSDFQGFFGHSRYPAEIKNIGLDNTTVTGNGYTGGLMGYNNEGSISNCYSTGNVNGVNYTGGLVGSSNMASIANCYSTVNVTGNDNTGGLVGDNNGDISNSYSSGSVIGESNTGGLVGINSSTVNNSFWDMQTSGQDTSSGGIGKTTIEMKNILTFTDAGWSFPYVWNIDPELNDGYPYLRSFNSVANDDVVIIPPTDSKAILKNAYPNPFNPSTTLSFELSSPESVKIDIYNVKGQLVKSLVKGAYNTGKHSIVWDGKDNKRKSACSGVYFYKMQAGKDSQTKKMMLMK